MTGLVAMRKSGKGTSLAVSVNDVTRVASGSGPVGLVTTIQLPNTNITGGTPPYSVLWTYESGDTDIAINNAEALNPIWSVVTDIVGTSAIWRCTVTDAALNTAEAFSGLSLFWFSGGIDI